MNLRETIQILGLAVEATAGAAVLAVVVAGRSNLPISRIERVLLVMFGASGIVVTMLLITATTNRHTGYTTHGWFLHLAVWLAPLAAVTGAIGVSSTRNRWRTVAVGVTAGGMALSLIVWAGLALIARDL
jgi:hypothetical protein